MDIRQELHEVPDEEEFQGPALLAQVMSRLDERPHRRSYPWQALIAAGLAVALVATFLVIRANRVAVNPADNGPILPGAANISGDVTYQFVSSQIGWLDIYTPARDTVITRTSDGGRSWRQQLVLSGLSPTPTMQFFNDRDGVVIGQNGKIPMVWQTSDGGIHWQSHPVLVGADEARAALPGYWAITSGYFLNGDLGWLLLEPDYGACSGCGLRPASALVYQTSDAGTHWSGLATLGNSFLITSTGLIGRGISFATSSIGFVTDRSLYVTVDSGRTWRVADVPFGAPTCPATPCGTSFIQAPILFTAKTGVLVATVAFPVKKACPSASPGVPPSQGNGCDYIYEPAARYLYTTSDGGLTWTESGQLPTKGLLDFVDSKLWVVVSVDGVSKTADGGASWTATRALPIPAGWYVSQLHFLDAQHGWVTLSDEDSSGAYVAAHGAIGAVWPKFAMLSTSDGGVTWHEVPLPSV